MVERRAKVSKSRKKIDEQLSSWQSGKLSVEEIHAWAESILDTTQYETFVDDWNQDDYSVSMEVLRILEMADLNLLIAEDIPLLRKLLTIDSIEELNSQADAYFKKVDFDKRKNDLKDIKYYVPSRESKSK